MSDGSTAANGHAKCYAASIGGCSTKISKEHYFSRAILQQIHETPIISGAPFAHEPKRIPIASLTANILCTTHNSKLSDLDANAAEVYRAIDRFDPELANAKLPKISSIKVRGEHLERWLLKVAFGICKGGIARGLNRGPKITQLRDEETLLRVLFGHEPMPEGWGMYLPLPNHTVGSPANIGFEPRTNPQTNEVFVFVCWIKAVEFWLCLGVPDGVPFIRRPYGIQFDEPKSGHVRQLQFQWKDSEKHEPVVMTRVGQQDEWFTR